MAAGASLTWRRCRALFMSRQPFWLFIYLRRQFGVEGIFCCVHPKLAAIHRKTAAPSSGRYEPHLHLHLIREYSSSSREKEENIRNIDEGCGFGADRKRGQKTGGAISSDWKEATSNGRISSAYKWSGRWTNGRVRRLILARCIVDQTSSVGAQLLLPSAVRSVSILTRAATINSHDEMFLSLLTVRLSSIASLRGDPPPPTLHLRRCHFQSSLTLATLQQLLPAAIKENMLFCQVNFDSLCWLTLCTALSIWLHLY